MVILRVMIARSPNILARRNGVEFITNSFTSKIVLRYKGRIITIRLLQASPININIWLEAPRALNLFFVLFCFVFSGSYVRLGFPNLRTDVKKGPFDANFWTSLIPPLTFKCLPRNFAMYLIDWSKQFLPLINVPKNNIQFQIVVLFRCKTIPYGLAMTSSFVWNRILLLSHFHKELIIWENNNVCQFWYNISTAISFIVYCCIYRQLMNQNSQVNTVPSVSQQRRHTRFST